MAATIVIDPTCRFAKREPGHHCRRNTGAPIREGESCFDEANMAGLEEAFVEATGLGELPAGPQPLDPDLPPCEADAVVCSCQPVSGLHGRYCPTKPADEPSIARVVAIVAALYGQPCHRCLLPGGPSHAPCRDHGRRHCSSDGCW